ncbi:Heat shock protein 70 [Ectocarpus siliculosus]|uniref:Heat shock protein 70 n=1 Tax=Ectocarpus siliculosus TaxID=2880 RepID=D7G709_ECTSI|nr:Heat shock protein 70 [Ectocarpus siliculosus]|eukprot:CBJ25702.1 Heat shock protein 70 [Ectocarpus siliculosus]
MAALVAEERWVGIDLGGDRSTTVLRSGEIIRSELGGHDTPNLVAFKARDRSIGEAAVSMVTSAPTSTVGVVHTMAGTAYSSWAQRAPTAHAAFRHAEASGGHPKGGVAVTVERQTGPQTFGGTEILAMYLCKLRACAAPTQAPGGGGEGASATACKGCFSSPAAASPVERRAVLDAARIAGFADAKVFPASDCLCAVYARKHPVSPGSAPETVIMVDVGRLQTTVVVARFGEGEGESDAPVAKADARQKENASAPCTYSVLAVRSNVDLGAFHFDDRMFRHFQGLVKKKYDHDVLPGSKQGIRLLLACRRLRELLSTTPTAETAVENLVDGVDVPLSMTRAELATLCEAELGEISSLVRGCLEEAAIDAGSLTGAQAIGGGCRMPIVQDVVKDEVGLPLGSRLDSASLAYGAALLAQGGESMQATEDALAAEGMSKEEIIKAVTDEHERQKEDAEVRAIALERNELESLLFDMGSAPNKKHGELIDKEALKAALGGLEDWLYSEEADDADLAALKTKRKEIDAELKGNVAKAFFEAVGADKKKVEAEMEAEAKAFEEEKKNNPEEGDDHDTRKLPKPERMRLVMKNKEEGTELFKGQNYRQAGARYSKALTHAAKMFDLNAEEQKEVHAVQLSLYLNLAQCYLKLQSWDQVVNNCTLALKLDAESSKALYRRAYARFTKKDYDNAKTDLDKALAYAPGDKAVATLLKKVDSVLKKQQEKEKKMWSKAFS